MTQTITVKIVYLCLMSPLAPTVQHFLENVWPAFWSAPVVVDQLECSRWVSMASQISQAEWTTICVKLYADIVQLKSNMSTDTLPTFHIRRHPPNVAEREKEKKTDRKGSPSPQCSGSLSLQIPTMTKSWIMLESIYRHRSLKKCGIKAYGPSAWALLQCACVF